MDTKFNLKAHFHDVFTDVDIIDDRVEVPRGEVKHPDVLVPPSSDHGSVLRYGQTVYLMIDSSTIHSRYVQALELTWLSGC